MNSAQITLLVAALASSLYWMLPPERIAARRGVILASSMLLIFLANPTALYLAIAVTLLAFAVLKLAQRTEDLARKRRLAFLVLIPMTIHALFPIDEWFPTGSDSALSPLAGPTMTLGLSFYTLKLFGSVNRAMKSDRATLGDLMTTSLFFPSFVAGPIDYADTFSNGMLSREFEVVRVAQGFSRVGTGLASLYVIAPHIAGDLAERWIGDPVVGFDWGAASWGKAMVAVYLSFARLFFDFAGATAIAIGVGHLFHLDISENFRRPYFAHSVQDFWQRWHLSLSTFITTYLFQPMVRRTGRPYLSIFAAFVLIGLWHEVSVGYLIWGLGHGAAMAMLLWRRRTGRGGRGVRTMLRPFSILLTLTFVAILSAIATEGSASDVSTLVRSLLPW